MTSDQLLLEVRWKAHDKEIEQLTQVEGFVSVEDSLFQQLHACLSIVVRMITPDNNVLRICHSCSVYLIIDYVHSISTLDRLLSPCL